MYVLISRAFLFNILSVLDRKIYNEKSILEEKIYFNNMQEFGIL
jgi:hypothetical protein